MTLELKPLPQSIPAPRPVPMGLLYTISRHRLGMSRQQALDFVDSCVEFAGAEPGRGHAGPPEAA